MRAVILREDDLVLDYLLAEHQEYYSMVQISPELLIFKYSLDGEASLLNEKKGRLEPRTCRFK